MSPVPKRSAPMHISATGNVVEKTTSGSSAPFFPNLDMKHFHGLESSTPSRLVLATTASSFRGIVTPVNIPRIHQDLSHHRNKTFMEKLCSELRKGALIGYSGPMAHLKSEVTANLRDEAVNGRTAGPFPSHLFENQQVFPAGLVSKKHSDKFRTIFHLSFPKSRTSSIEHYIEENDLITSIHYNYNASAAIYKFVPHCFMAKTDKESAFRLFPVHPNNWELLGMFWNGFYNFKKVFPFLASLWPPSFLTNCRMPLSGFYVIIVQFHLHATFWITSLSLILLLAPGPLLSFETNAFEPN